MTDKREKPLFIDMDTDEALERFLQTDPGELKKRLNKKAPPKRGQRATGTGRPSKPPPD